MLSYAELAFIILEAVPSLQVWLGFHRVIFPEPPSASLQQQKIDAFFPPENRWNVSFMTNI